MTGYICGLLMGVAWGAYFHYFRTRGIRRAIRAALEQRDVALLQVDRLSADLVRQRQRISKIKLFAQRIQMERIINLGGAALLPAPAEREGQRVAIDLYDLIHGGRSGNAPVSSRSSRG